jgi:hypothetical protein
MKIPYKTSPLQLEIGLNDMNSQKNPSNGETTNKAQKTSSGQKEKIEDFSSLNMSSKRGGRKGKHQREDSHGF